MVASLHCFRVSGESFFSSAALDSSKLLEAHHLISTVLFPGHLMLGCSAFAGISGSNISSRSALIFLGLAQAQHGVICLGMLCLLLLSMPLRLWCEREIDQVWLPVSMGGVTLTASLTSL